MKYAEAAGLVKFDFLGLKTLTVLQRAIELIELREEAPDLLSLPLSDPKTFKMLSRGETVGVFQLESSGMRDVLRQLKPDTFEDIIALVALYRPGPMDNIPRYIACKHGKEEPDYLHPDLQPILEETFGVMIYQEQVMQIAQVLSGYSLGGADLLRRDVIGVEVVRHDDRLRRPPRWRRRRRFDWVEGIEDEPQLEVVGVEGHAAVGEDLLVERELRGHDVDRLLG